MGKWHAGYFESAATPQARGFDTAFGFFGRAKHYFSHCAIAQGKNSCEFAPDDPQKSPLIDQFWAVGGKSFYAGRKHPDVINRTYATHAFTREAVQRVMEHDVATPMFMYLAYSAVHDPKQATDTLMFRAKEQPALASRDPSGKLVCGWLSPTENPSQCNRDTKRAHDLIEAMALGVDDGVGDLHEALRAKGMWDTTLLVMSSDNGGGVSSASTNYPLRGGKFTPFEGGVRVAAALGGGWVPSALRGRIANNFMHMVRALPFAPHALDAALPSCITTFQVDWLPTFAHVAGASINTSLELGAPELDGRSAWPQWLELLKVVSTNATLQPSTGVGEPHRPRISPVSTRRASDACPVDNATQWRGSSCSTTTLLSS